MATLVTTNLPQPASAHETGLVDLPQELFDQILDLLPASDAINLVRTDRHFFQANWQRVYRTYIKASTENRDHLCYWAARKGFRHAIELVLDEGLDVNALIYDRASAPRPLSGMLPAAYYHHRPDHECHVTMLHVAVNAEQVALSLWLLEDKGADPNTRSRGPGVMSTVTVIAMAIVRQRSLALRLARQYQPEPFGRGSALSSAIRRHRIDLVWCLCNERGADVNDAQGYIGTPLVLAVSYGTPSIVKVLLAHGAHVDAVAPLRPPTRGPRRGRTVLTAVLAATVVTPNEAMLRCLVAHGAGLDIAVDDGHEMRTPLGTAIHQHHLPGALLLLKLGAHPNGIIGPLQWTPYGTALHRLAHLPQPTTAMVDLLVAHGADPNSGPWNQLPAVFLAMRLGVTNPFRRELLRWILDHHRLDLDAPLPPALHGQSSRIPPSPRLLHRATWTALHECLAATQARERQDRLLVAADGVCTVSLVGLLLDHGADPFGGHHPSPADGDETEALHTPLGTFLQLVMRVLQTSPTGSLVGHGGLMGRLAAVAPEYDAMFAFLCHRRGAASLIHYRNGPLALLLAAIVLLPPVSTGHWFGATPAARVRRFAEAVHEHGGRPREVHQAVWLGALFRHSAYWYAYEECGRDGNVWRFLRRAAGTYLDASWPEMPPVLG